MNATAVENLSYRDLLPLSWSALSEALSPVARDQMAEGNVAVLSRLASLEERAGRKGEEDDVQQKISRLSNKLDLLIEMVAMLVRERQPLPPVVEMNLSAQQLIWQAQGDVPSAGAYILVLLHVHAGMAPPLRLPMRVEQVEGMRITAQIEHPSEAALSALEQHVFLHHRRAIAESRKQ